MTRATEVSLLIPAPVGAVFAAFLDGEAIQQWLAPEGMRGTVHTYEPRAGGRIHMSLTYLGEGEGKTTGDTDTFQGTVAEVVPGERLVWLVEFDSSQPEFAGTMRMVWSLLPRGEGTVVTCRCEDIPPGIRPEDNEEGTRQTLASLAAFVGRG